MTIQSDVIEFLRNAYPAAFRRVAGAANAPPTELVVIDMMLELRGFIPPAEGMAWKDALRVFTHTVRDLLACDGTRVVVAVFDRPGDNAAKMLVHRARAARAPAPVADGAGWPALTDPTPRAWGALVARRAWRNDVLIPRAARFLSHEGGAGVPDGKVLVVDAAPHAIAVTAHGAFRVARAIADDLAPCTEADHRMLSWLALPGYARLSASVWSVDGDEVVALMLFFPAWTRRTPPGARRRLQWLRKRRDAEHRGELDVVDIRALDAAVRADFLLGQLEWQAHHAADPGVEISDYRAIWAALCLMRGCDFVEPHRELTFATLVTAYFTHIHHCGNFLLCPPDPRGGDDVRAVRFDLELYRFLVKAAYGLRYGFQPLDAPLERIRETGSYTAIPSEPELRQRAARLKWALGYFANAWNPRAYPLPDPLERQPDPANPAADASIYGLELVDTTRPPSPGNVRLAASVIV